MASGTEGANTITEVEKYSDLMQVDIGWPESGKTFVTIVAELASNTMAFFQQITGYRISARTCSETAPIRNSIP